MPINPAAEIGAAISSLQAQQAQAAEDAAASAVDEARVQAGSVAQVGSGNAAGLASVRIPDRVGAGTTLIRAHTGRLSQTDLDDLAAGKAVECQLDKSGRYWIVALLS